MRRVIRWISITLVVVSLIIAGLWYNAQPGFEPLLAVLGAFVSLLTFFAASTRAERLEPDYIAADVTQKLSHLRRQMNSHLNSGDLRTLCFDFGIDYDNLLGETKKERLADFLRQANLNGVLPALIETLETDFPHVPWANPTSAPTLSPRERRNLLNKINHIWLDGVLRTTLHERVKLDLGLTYEADLVQRAVQQVDGASRPIPQGETIADIFDRAGRALLILGAPGSGKTTTLLQLGESLLERARASSIEPIPLILNLSSYSPDLAPSIRSRRRWLAALSSRRKPEIDEDSPLTRWLAAAAWDSYALAEQPFNQLLAAGQIVLLLDGLDEVDDSLREACLHAINQSLPLEIVVTSRLNDYEALSSRLHVTTAVRILPLTDAQIALYLSQDLPAIQAAREILAADTQLRELAASPLMLSIMVLAFQGTTTAEIEQLTRSKNPRSQLFDRYVTRMFERRPLDGKAYTTEEARRALGLIARGMTRNFQSTFNPTSLNKMWLPTQSLLADYQKAYRRLFHGLNLINSTLVYSVILSFFGQPLLGVAAGLLNGLVAIRTDQPIERDISLGFRWGWQISKMTIPWLIARSALVGGLTSGLLAAALATYGRGWDFGWRLGSVIGLSITLVIWLGGSLIDGLEYVRSAGGQEANPNPFRGLYISLWSSLSFAGISFILVFATVTLVTWPFFGLDNGLYFGSVFGLGLFLTFWLVDDGNRDVLTHFVLRRLLARQEMLPFPWPWQNRALVRFLDDMVDRILLQRVGGNWRFIHRMLQEHLAQRFSSSLADPLDLLNWLYARMRLDQ